MSTLRLLRLPVIYEVEGILEIMVDDDLKESLKQVEVTNESSVGAGSIRPIPGSLRVDFEDFHLKQGLLNNPLTPDELEWVRRESQR